MERITTMRNKPIRIEWTCPRCYKIIVVLVYPRIPAQISGPPENCYPEEEGEIEPDQCDECATSIDIDEMHEKASKQIKDEEVERRIQESIDKHNEDYYD